MSRFQVLEVEVNLQVLEVVVNLQVLEVEQRSSSCCARSKLLRHSLDCCDSFGGDLGTSPLRCS